MKKRTTNKNLKGTGKPQATSVAANARKRTVAPAASSAETEVPEKDAFQELERSVQSEIERGLETSVSANAADAAEDETDQVDETDGEESNEVEGEEATTGEEDPSGSATAEGEGPDGSADAEGDTEEEEDPSGSATAEGGEEEPEGEAEGESDEMSDEFLAEAEAKGWSLSAKRRLWKLLKKNEQLQQQLTEREDTSVSASAPAGTVTGREAELPWDLSARQ